jgi:hypothetical protein
VHRTKKNRVTTVFIEKLRPETSDEEDVYRDVI